LQKFVRKQRIKYFINIAFSLIFEFNYWRLFTWIVINDTMRHSIITISENCMQITHQIVILRMTSWRQNIIFMIDFVNKFLKNILFFDQHDASLYSINSLIDNYVDNKSDKSFLDELKNQLNVVKNWLYNRMKAISTLRRKFFFVNNSIKIRQSKINNYLLTMQQFLRIIVVLIYTISNLSSRRKKFIDAAWCNRETIRNLYLSHELMILINDYHKIAWKIDFRSIVRFFLFAIDELLMRYFIYVFRFVHFFCRNMQYFLDRDHFFEKRNQIWSFDQFDIVLKRQTTLQLSFAIINR
jgi:hypothetical protein